MKISGEERDLSGVSHELVSTAIPFCPKCAIPMWVVHIEHNIGQDRRTYECPQCELAIKGALNIADLCVAGSSSPLNGGPGASKR
jgi:hypothetical protein